MNHDLQLLFLFYFSAGAVQDSPKYFSSIYIAQWRTVQSVMHLFDRSCRRVDAHDQFIFNLASLVGGLFCSVNVPAIFVASSG